LGCFLLASHGGALLALLLCKPPAGLALMAVCILLGSLHYALQRHASRRHPAAVRTLVWEAGNRWQLRLQSGEMLQAALLPQAFIRPYLVILRFRYAGCRRSAVTLLPDMLDAGSFRRLRVRLLIELNRAEPGEC